MTYKPKVMLHYVMPGATGGPNVSFRRIESMPILSKKYDFIPLEQKRVAGGKINISLIFELRKKIKEINPDIIHISGMQSAGFHCMMAAFLAGCKNRLIATRGFSGDALELSPIKRFAFNYLIEPLTLLLATKVQGISKYTVEKNMVKKFAKNKSCYIYNFPPNGNDVNPTRSIRKELGISNEEIVFTTVSRVVLDKGYKELGQAIHSLKDLNNIRFLIVGDGSYEEIFREAVKDEIDSGKVLMLGKRNDVMNILAGSNVFILPTLHENLGNVFLEASVSRIPSIGTNVGGVPEIIINGETGLLVPPHNSKSLEDAILKLYNNEILRIEMGQKAYFRVNSKFSTNKIAAQFDKLYSSMLSK